MLLGWEEEWGTGEEQGTLVFTFWLKPVCIFWVTGWKQKPSGIVLFSEYIWFLPQWCPKQWVSEFNQMVWKCLIILLPPWVYLINQSFMFVECLVSWILVGTLRFQMLLLNRREALCTPRDYSLFDCSCDAFPNWESTAHEAVPSSFEMWNCKIVPQCAFGDTDRWCDLGKSDVPKNTTRTH